jgi:ureidoglycolate lyase
MTQAGIRRRVLRAMPATPEAIAPFGALVASDDRVAPIRSAFYGDALEIRKPARLVNDADIELSVARLRRRPMEALWLERHFLHTQAFIPLGGKPFAMILAPPSEGDLPDLDRAAAFVFAGDQGLAMHVGTWHEFPLAIEDGTEIVVLLRRQTVQDLARRDGNEASGPDLEKRDLELRFGLRLAVELPGPG